MLELLLLFRKEARPALAKAVAFATSPRHPRLCFLALRLALEHLMERKREDEIARALDAEDRALGGVPPGPEKDAVARRLALLTARGK